jgi:hypothetical protein
MRNHKYSTLMLFVSKTPKHFYPVIKISLQIYKNKQNRLKCWDHTSLKVGQAVFTTGRLLTVLCLTLPVGRV